MTLDVSVVIGFRNWNLSRLRRCVQSLQRSTGSLSFEVIISDYGSDDPTSSLELARELNVRHVSTPGDPVWSRSRALNAGFEIAQGNLLISTDADMLFAPGALSAIHGAAAASQPSALFLQCRDLPESTSDCVYDDLDNIDWSELEAVSTLRPRWGMGGMMAIRRDGFDFLNGFDERLHTYGREDMDFALRARRAGFRMLWVQDPAARMFHMWHPPTSIAVTATESGRNTINRNRRIVDSDMSTTRNVTRATGPSAADRPLVHLIIVADSDEADPVETTASALTQSVSNSVVTVIDTSERNRFDFPSGRCLTVYRCRPDEVDGNLCRTLAHSNATYTSVVRAGTWLPTDRIEVLLNGILTPAIGAVGEVEGSAEAETGHGSISGDAAATCGVYRTDALRLLVETTSQPPLQAMSSLPRLMKNSGLTTSDVAVAVTSSTARSDRGPLGANLLLDELPPAGGTLGDRLTTLRITHGESERLVERYVLEGPSPSEVVELASASSTARLVHADDNRSSNQLDWFSTVVRHVRSRCLNQPLLVRLLDGSHASLSSSTEHGAQDRYKVESGDDVLEVRVSELTDASQTTRVSTTEPGYVWMVVGATPEEVWQ